MAVVKRLSGCCLGMRTNVRTDGNARAELFSIQNKINVNSLWKVLIIKSVHVLHWPKPADVQPIKTFVHSNLCPSTDIRLDGLWFLC